MLPKRILSEIVKPRMEELFSLVKLEIIKSGYYSSLPAGIVLSGGGAQLRGSIELCSQITGMHTRIGLPRDVGGLVDTLRSPVYSTGIGLVQYGVQHHFQTHMAAKENSLVSKLHRWLNRIMGREFEH